MRAMRQGKKLKLKGCDTVFTLFDWGRQIENIEVGGLPVCCIHYIATYRDSKNNVLEITQVRDEFEEAEDMAAVFDTLPEAVSRHLAGVLTINHDITVCLCQPGKGTLRNVAIFMGTGYACYMGWKALGYDKPRSIAISGGEVVIDPPGADPFYVEVRDGIPWPMKALT